MFIAHALDITEEFVTLRNFANGHKMNFIYKFTLWGDGFGGLVVSILATGTRVHGFKPERSRWIFRASGKSSVCLPSEGK